MHTCRLSPQGKHSFGVASSSASLLSPVLAFGNPSSLTGWRNMAHLMVCDLPKPPRLQRNWLPISINEAGMTIWTGKMFWYFADPRKPLPFPRILRKWLHYFVRQGSRRINTMTNVISMILSMENVCINKTLYIVQCSAPNIKQLSSSLP